MSVVWIDKLEAARRQIKAAVRLFFEETEPVAVHTLVAPAHQMLVDIGSKRGIYGALKNATLLQSAEAQEYLKNVNFAFNYIKHADRDDDVKINVEPLQRFTSDVLLDAIALLQRIAGDIPIEAKVFWTWFLSRYPEEFADVPVGGALDGMKQQDIGKWEFKTIRRLLDFAGIMGHLP